MRAIAIEQVVAVSTVSVPIDNAHVLVARSSVGDGLVRRANPRLRAARVHKHHNTPISCIGHDGVDLVVGYQAVGAQGKDHDLAGKVLLDIALKCRTARIELAALFGIELARNGFDVTVFEAFFTGGGVLVYGIPEFRLPKAVVKREIDGLEDMGVKFEYNSVVGNMTTAEELFEQGFDAIYVATGAGLPKFLNVPGENLPNVFFANEYLTRVNLMKANKFPEYDTPTKHGKNVVVFGGGNVAMDAVRTAKRLGAEHAIIAYRRTEDEMPCRRAELHHAKAEGVEVLPLVSPLEFVAGEDGSVCAVKVQKMELGEPDESGRRRPVPIEGAIEEIPCDVAISAIGTNANPFAKKIGGKMELNKWGYIVADEETGQTTDPRIWAGGDIVTGAATVILAMGAGKKAAASITKSLLGE